MILNRKFGDYILLRRLAVGGQSEVFLAVKSGPRDYNRPVVIKALPTKSKKDEKLVKLFYREAFISSRFGHQNVINIHDARLIEGDHCMLMDFVNGQTVADIAQRGYASQRPPDLKQVVQIVADAADGLAYFHDFTALDNTNYSVAHLDISPQNIMVTYQGVAMVFDFGIAKIMGQDHAMPKSVGGKYAYMSPEQVEGQDVDPRSDIFSLGIILYELCTGFRLFRRNSPPEVLKAIQEEEITPPRELKPEVPQFLEGVIMKALARDPAKRYQTATLFRQDLLRYLDLTTEGGDLRKTLGAYVAAMFEQERAEIAQALQAAPLFDVEEVEDAPAARPPEARPEDDVRPADPDGTARGEPFVVPSRVERREIEETLSIETYREQDREQAFALELEVSEMQRRQTRLYAVIAVLAVVAVLLGFAAVV